MKSNAHITGIILAGGKSTRMGSDKGFIPLNGKHFIAHIVDALKPQVSEILIVSNNNAYDHLGHTRIEDLIKDAGPLAGLYSGLNASKTINNIVLSCDIPLINPQVLALLTKSVPTNTDVVMVESNGQTMPLVAMYKTHCKQHFYKLLQAGERSLHRAIAPLNVKTIQLEPGFAHYVKNINTPGELKELQR
ncbi:MAG: molybdenum cofactor guanylyltransferase [Gilvibacter sp.]